MSRSSPRSALLGAALCLLSAAALAAPQPPAEPKDAKPATLAQARTDLYGDPLPDGAVARLGSVRFRHRGMGIARYAKDGNTIVSLCEPNEVCHWDALSGQRKQTIEVRGESVSLRALSRDAKWVAGIDDKEVRTWEAASGAKRAAIPRSEAEPALLVFSPDGMTVAIVAWDGQTTFWNWQRGTKSAFELPQPRNNDESMLHPCFSPDGKWFVAGGGSHQPLCVYDVESAVEVHRLPGQASACCISPDNHELVTASIPNEASGQETVLYFHDLTTGRELRQFSLGHYAAYSNLAFAARGQTLACGGAEGHACLFDCATGKVLHELPGRAADFAFSPDDKTLLARVNHQLHFFDVATGKEQNARPGDFAETQASAVSDDGALLATIHEADRAVSLWDVRSGKLWRRLPFDDEGRDVLSLFFARDGKTLITCHQQGLVQYWDVDGGKRQREVQLDAGNSASFEQFHFSRDGRCLSTIENGLGDGGDIGIGRWDANTGELLKHQVFPQHDDGGAWTADGMAVIMLRENVMEMLEVDTGQPRLQTSEKNYEPPLTVSPDDRFAAACTKLAEPAQPGDPESRQKVRIWEVASGRQLVEIGATGLTDLVFTKDSRFLVGVENLLVIWDVATGKVHYECQLPDAVHRFHLLPDARHAILFIDDGTGLVWDLSPAWKKQQPVAKGATEKELVAWWQDLAAVDAPCAYGEVWKMREAPADAVVPFLSQRLKPVVAAKPARVAKLLKELDSPQAEVRESATKELIELRGMAHGELKKALDADPPEERKKRLQEIFYRAIGRTDSVEVLRTVRAIHVLETLATPDARRLLGELAGGAEYALETRHARAALERLK